VASGPGLLGQTSNRPWDTTSSMSMELCSKPGG
jgi:hypothetical protein